MRALVNTVQPYAWGSTTAIATLQRRPVPAPGPEAELWLGAHPSAPSRVASAATGDLVALTDEIAAEAPGILGDVVMANFGARLPYLLKILAAAAPLSLQVHPDSDQARRGYDAEERAGVPVGAPERNYVDPHHKPELLVALTGFEALCGFRDPEQSAQALAALRVPALAPVIAALRSGSSDERLRSAVRLLLAWPPGERVDVVKQVAASGHELATALAQEYPGDVGVIIALLLNHVRLRPDEAIFMPAGNLHAYLRGVGVEVMAASDNVLRCGLTPKHVDVAETMRIVRYAVLSEPVVVPRGVWPGTLSWAAPVPDFSLVRVDVEASTGPVRLPGAGPRVIICVKGTAHLRAGSSAASVEQGDAVFVAADEPAVHVRGERAAVFEASPGPLPVDWPPRGRPDRDGRPVPAP